MYYNYRTYNITWSARVIIIAQDQAVCTCVIITARTGSGGVHVYYNYRMYNSTRSASVIIIAKDQAVCTCVIIIARTGSGGLYVL